MWCGNHWQPVSCDAKQDVSGTHDTQTTEEEVPTVKSVCANCQCHLNNAKGFLTELSSLKLHSSSNTGSSGSSNVLQQYSRCLEYEEKLVKLFDSTATITAKEDLLHSLR